MSARVDLELSIRDVDPAEAVAVWQRLNLVGQGFLSDGREVSVVTYRYTDDDEVESLVGPPEDKEER